MRAHVARNRKLVISSICTVANYEYGFYFNFALDGSIELEVKATGIVNAYCLGPNEPRDPSHEVEVAPNIAAQHHQHVSRFHSEREYHSQGRADGVGDSSSRTVSTRCSMV
jgi:primary-amine oxidase